ncbi:dihydroorotase [candidate division WOR-3 bacterium]|nr:dihydroorotase [candidate division WOR-3 bacterium]
MDLKIKNVHLFDPLNKIDEVGTLLIDKGKVIKGSESSARQEIDGKGLYLFPGFVDVHSHFREPGAEDAETIETGSKAAVKGGYTSVCVMPNTGPPIDNEGLVRFIKEKSEEVGLCRVFPIGTVTKGRKGKELSEMAHLYEAGCVAFSDDGDCVMNSSVMRNALEYSKLFNVPIIDHPEDVFLSNKGQMHEGSVSTELGFKGIPDISESTVVARDILLSKFTQGRIHLAHVSTADSVKLIKDWETDKVTSEVTPHHLLLSDDEIKDFDPNKKMKPPLRTRYDVEVMQKAVKDGLIEVVATDHAPHPDYKKELEFAEAAFGVTGLETSFAVLYTELVKKGKLTLGILIKALSSSPCNIFNLPLGEVKEGATADFTIVDLKGVWEVTTDVFASKAKNSPFLGRKLKGIVRYCIVDGRTIFKNGDFIS